MSKIKNPQTHSRGFIALVSVMMLAFGAIVIATAVLASAVVYADGVTRRELRIQAKLNLSACLDASVLRISRDFFVRGAIRFDEFGCLATVQETSPNMLNVQATATMPYANGSVQLFGRETLMLTDKDVQLTSRNEY